MYCIDSRVCSVLFVLTRKLRAGGEALVASTLIPRAKQLLASDPDTFDRTVLPFLKRLGAESKSKAVQNPKLTTKGLNTGLRPLVIAAIDQVKSRLPADESATVQQPTHWAVSARVQCSDDCADCKSITAFLQSPTAQHHEFNATIDKNKHVRSNLHSLRQYIEVTDVPDPRFKRKTYLEITKHRFVQRSRGLNGVQRCVLTRFVCLCHSDWVRTAQAKRVVDLDTLRSLRELLTAPAFQSDKPESSSVPARAPAPTAPAERVDVKSETPAATKPVKPASRATDVIVIDDDDGVVPMQTSGSDSGGGGGDGSSSSAAAAAASVKR